MVASRDENPFWSDAAKRGFRERQTASARGPVAEEEDMALAEELRRKGMLELETKIQEAVAKRQKPVESGSYHTVETGGRDGEPGRKASRKVPEPPGLQSGGPAVTAGESLTESPSSCQSFDGTDG